MVLCLLLRRLNAAAASQYRVQHHALLMPRVKIVIPGDKERYVRSRSPRGNVRLKEREKRLHELLLLSAAIRAEEEEAKGHDVVELLPEGGGVVIRGHVLLQESHEGKSERFHRLWLARFFTRLSGKISD